MIYHIGEYYRYNGGRKKYKLGLLQYYCWAKNGQLIRVCQTKNIKMQASLRAKELLMQHYEKVSGIPMTVISKMVQFFNTDSHYKTAKECALITVAYLKNENSEFFGMVGQTFNNDYWDDVENELIKL